MNELAILKPCSFCGGNTAISVSDDEDNKRDEEYKRNSWSSQGESEQLVTDQSVYICNDCVDRWQCRYISLQQPRKNN